MANDEPPRRLRDRFLFRHPKEREGDSGISTPVRGVRSSDSQKTKLSIFHAVAALSPMEDAVLLQASNQEEVPKEANVEKSLQPPEPSPLAAEPSLWTLAYKSLQDTNPELIENFNYCLGISPIDADIENFVYLGAGGIAQKALDELKEANTSKEKLKGTSAKIRKHFEQAVKVVVASKDFISSAVSANPYAALAWTGVTLLLPLLLNPTMENEAAIKGLDYIANLLIVYKWQEKTYLCDKNAGPDFKELAIRLYTKILEYEATLLVHMHQNPPKRWVRNIFQAGDWLNRATDIKQYDDKCREVTNAIASFQAQEWRDEERKWQAELLQQPRQDEEKRYIRMLYSNYEAGKNVNPERIPGTCEWFLKHTGFLTWRESQSASLLWLSADPGCGKSVLSKYLVDRKGEVLTGSSEIPVVCYFFFKDGDVDRMNGVNAMCAFLHQLILQQPQLYQYAKEEFENKNEKFLTDFDALWNIFLNATGHHSSREIICVLDALDECREHSRKALIDKLVLLYSLRNSTDTGKPILKFLVTSRPEFMIVRDFSALSEVRLYGEQESEQISREINLVICNKVRELGKKMGLNERDRSDLRKNLLKIPHRTYLWLHLTFGYIANKLRLSRDDIAVITSTIPETVSQAYTAILEKSPDEDRARRLLHVILAATRPLTLQEANVALVIEERNESSTDLDIWQPDEAEDTMKNVCGLFLNVVDSKVYLIHQTAREFLVCKKHTKLSDIPQVCEKYTKLSDIPQASSSTVWKTSFCPVESNLLLAKICIWYLQLRDFQKENMALFLTEKQYNERIYVDDKGESEEDEIDDEDNKGESEDNKRESEDNKRESEDNKRDNKRIQFDDEGESEDDKRSLVDDEGGSDDDAEGSEDSERLKDFQPYHDKFHFLSYAARHWAAHFTQAGRLPQPSLVATVANKTCDTLSESFNVWFRIYWEAEEHRQYPLRVTDVLVAAYFGHDVVVELLLGKKNADVKDSDGRTPLSWAAERGHEPVVRMLLESNKVDINFKDNEGRTPLSWAAEKGHEGAVRLLLKQESVKVDSTDNGGRTPLSWAAERGHEPVVRVLLESNKVDINFKDNEGRTPLSWAAAERHKGCDGVVKLLLEQKDVQLNSKDAHDWKPLHLAALLGAEKVVKLLLERKDVQINATDNANETPLFLAAIRGYEAVVKLLLERKDVDINKKDVFWQSPLFVAAKEGHEGIVKLLLARKDVEVDLKDGNGRTPLSVAAKEGHEGIVKLLLARKDVEEDFEDGDGRTPLMEARDGGYDEIVKMLEQRRSILQSNTLPSSSETPRETKTLEQGLTTDLTNNLTSN